MYWEEGLLANDNHDNELTWAVGSGNILIGSYRF